MGIIAYFCYNYLTSRIDNVVYEIENATIEFMDVLNEPEKPQASEKTEE